jgi:hypothetical protein
MGLGGRFRFDKPEAKRFQDGLEDLPVFDETDDSHDSPKLRASQGVDLPQASVKPYGKEAK